METVQRRQTISKLSRIPGYAGGGIIPQPPAQPAVQPSVDPMASKPFMSATGENLGNVLGPKMFAKPNDAQPVTNPKSAPLSPNPVQVAYQNGYAGGGLIDKLKGVFGGGSAPPQPPPPKDPPPEPVATDIWSQTRKRRETEAGLAGGSKVKPGMAKAAMAGMGGMLQGPGTPTSDDIPAKVVDTGEPIKVATGERIVSKKQDAFLQQLAQEKGFPSVDAMLEAGTGEPVGPTMRFNEGKRGAFSGASPDDLERQKLVAQIPTGGAPGAGPTAQPDPSRSASGSELERNVSNITGALAPIAGGARMMMAAGKVGSALGQSAMAGKAVGLGAKVMPYAVPAAAAIGLSNAASSDTPAPIAKATAAVPAPQVAAPTKAVAPAAPSTIPADQNAAARLGGLDAGNQAALTAKAERDALTQRDIALGNQMQADRESRDAANFASGQNQQAVEQTIANKVDNERARQRAETTLSSIVNNDGTRAQKAAAAQTLAALDRQDEGAQRDLSAAQRLATTDQTTRRGQDITASDQAVQADATKASQRLAQDRFGIEKSQEARNAAKADMDAKQQARLQAAFDAYDKEPSEDNAARVRVLTGKEKAPAPDLFDKIQTGVDPITNVPIYSLYNKRTGEMSGQQAKPQGQYETGKVYTDAKGNRAKWDGKAFVPA